MATTSEHINTNVNKKEDEEKKLDGEKDNKTTTKVDDLNQIGKTDKLSTVQSINEDKKSDQISPTSDNNIEKKNEEKKVETTTTTEKNDQSDTNIKKEETSTTITSSNTNDDEDSNKKQSTISSATSNDIKKEESTTDNKNDFHIEKGDEQHLTDFQRQKAKYFFNVNLDIENKGYVTWDDVEFYLLFHVTAAGKEGSNGGDLEGRLSRATRAFWEHVHDQLPLPDGKRDKLTLDQFLDTWASLIDYVVDNNKLPSLVQDLVKLGFELYSTDDENGKSTIQPQAFDQLFQKMNLGRPYAIMAYKYLTENGTKPLDADKIDSIVKAVITSSDDENDSHFLLPGFFKTITSNKNNGNDNKNKNQSETDESDSQKPSTSSPSASSSSTSFFQTQSSNKTSSPPSTPKAQQQKGPSSPPPPQQQQKSNEPSSSPKAQQPKAPSSPPPQQQQKPNEPPSSSKVQEQKGPSSPPPPTLPQQQQKPNQPPSSPKVQQQNGPAQEKQPDKPAEPQKQPSPTSQNGVNKSFKSPPPNNQQQNIQPQSPSSAQIKPQKAVLQQEDESIRNLLRYYHIDDGDIVEVAGGSVQRVVLVHPERPLPPYIQQNKQLLQQIQSDFPNVSSAQQNGLNNNGKPSQPPPTETKPKVTLEERVSRGEAQKGPTIPSRPDQKQENLSSTGVRQVYPKLNEAQQEEQQKQAKLQATQPNNNNEKQTKEETSATNDVSLSSKQDETKQTKDLSRDEEEKKIVAAVLKQLEPIIEKRVAAELRRIQSGDTDEDEDENIIPFPFMFGGGFPIFAAPRGGPPPQVPREQQQNASGQGQQQIHGPGIQGGSAFIPPQLLMAMMNDLARGDMGGEIPSFSPNMPPPPHGPVGVEGFMMFVDDDQLIGGLPGYPPRPGPGF